jgi:CubicO group peptidase (beta-lactamase class C family)
MFKMKLSLVRCALCLWLSLCSAGLTAQAIPPDANASVDQIFSDLQKPGSPGCALGVYRDGKALYTKGYGLASVELNAPITPQTVFDIGSTSKQFTATSILLLEKQGKLSLSDDIRKYLPELPDYSKNGGPKITILNLLNHTSGLRDYLSLLDLSGVNIDSVTTDEDALAIVARQQNLNFTPGSDFLYSNTGYFLLSQIVKRVSGMNLREFAAQNIFQPLGMTHTMFRDDHTKLITHRALAYDPDGKNGYKLNVSYFEQLGDGAVHTSVEDLLKWDENFYSAQVGGKNLISELQERGKLTNGKVLEYAKALFIGDYRGLATVRHGGAWGGYRAELLRFPQQHFSVACLCNLSNANPEKRAERVSEVYLGNLMKPEGGVEAAASPAILEKSAAAGGSPGPEVTLTSAQLSGLTGMYRNEKGGNIARVSVADGKPQMEIFGGTFKMRALSPTEFTLVDFPVDAKISFDVANQGAKIMKVAGEEGIAATYRGVTEFSPSANELSRFAGNFKSEELGVIYRLQVVSGKLNLVGISEPSGIPRTGIPVPNPLRPTITDEFELSSLGVNLHFLRNGAEITGFDLGAGRSQGIHFLRLAQAATH